MESEIKQTHQQENGFISLIFNILIPVLLLSKGDNWIKSPALVLIIALSFPILYFFYDLYRRKKVNFISILGFISVLLTGGVGLFQLPRFWFIVKETAIPGIIGLGVLISAFTRKPLVKFLILNPSIFDVAKINTALQERGTQQGMNQLLTQSTWLLSLSFFISAFLNFILARHLIVTEPAVDQVQFNAEVGAMTGWSYLIIALPSIMFMIGIIYHLTHGIKQLTGLRFEECLANHLQNNNP